MRHLPTKPVDYQYELALLSEECGEVNQIIGKIFRHGIESVDPKNPTEKNYDLLHLELGDVLAAINFASERGLLDPEKLNSRADYKLEKLKQIAPEEPMISSDHLVEVVIDNGGMSEKEEMIAKFIALIFIVIAIVSSWFVSAEVSKNNYQSMIADEARLCLIESATNQRDCSDLMEMAK